MREFSKKINANNKNNFSKYRFDRNLAYLRREITENILIGDEENYFDLDKFKTRFDLVKEDLDKMVEIVSTELRNLDWKVEFTYGQTAMFIYSNDTPSNFYPDEF